MRGKSILFPWNWTLPCIFIFFGLCAMWANIDLTAGRFALFMDERITFDGVKRILHPSGITDFIFSVSNGNDHRYGRVLWYSMAAFSYLPERLFGDGGQIVAGRLFQVLLTLASCSICIFGMVRTQWLRVVLALSLLTVPYSAYYMTMPKPEPLQLLFLSLFCYFFSQNKECLGWHWIFAGLAFGAKISTLPAILVFAAASLWLSHNKSNSERCNNLLLSIGSFFLGLAISVPILMPSFFLALAVFSIFLALTRKFCLKWYWKALALLAVACVDFVLTKHFITLWIRATFLNTAHSADQASTNALSWINFLFKNWLIGPQNVNVIFFLFICSYVLCSAYLLLQKPFRRDIFTAITIIASGAALNAAIFIGAKRLWGFYLYPGTFIILVGTALLIDINIKKEQGPHALFKHYSKIVNRGCAIILLCFVTSLWMPSTIKNFQNLSQRTKSTEYVNQYESYKIFTNFLEQYSISSEKMLQVAFSPFFFPPNNTKHYRIMEFWGPFTQWRNAPDVILLAKHNTPRGAGVPENSPTYKNFINEREGYARHVTEQSGTCAALPCFERVTQLPNEGEILVLQKQK